MRNKQSDDPSRETASSGGHLPSARRPDGPVLADLVEQARFEVLPTPGVQDLVRAHLPVERVLTVTASPGRGLEATLAVAVALAGDGYRVVPHVAARMVVDRSHLQEIVDRLREAGIDDLFVPGGDAEAVGDYADATSLLRDLASLDRPFRSVGIAAYPESHPSIPDDRTIQAMWEKRDLATELVSNITFDPEVVGRWLAHVRRRGVGLPLWLGVPGPSDPAKLLAVATRIGVGESTRFLVKNRRTMARLLRPGGFSSEDFLRRVEPVLARPDLRVAGLHVFTFNQIAATETWRAGLLEDLRKRGRRPVLRIGARPLIRVPKTHPPAPSSTTGRPAGTRSTAMNANIPSVDQSDRTVPINLRQSGPTPVEMLVDTRVRKSPYWHLSHQAGCWRASVYNRMYHPRGYVRPEDGGAMVEYDALVNHVTLWNVAVERQIQVKGPEAAEFVDFVITRDATKIPPMRARYVILCNEKGGVLNDPVLLHVAEDEYWFSLSDSDLMYWLQGVNVGRRFDVDIAEIDVAPLQVQGPKSVDLMSDLFGSGIRDIPSYGLYAGNVEGCEVIVSQTGFSGEKGYEIYLKDATLHAETLWYAILEAGMRHQLQVIAPAHHRRVAAGILSWGQDMDAETLPFQVNLGYQVPRLKEADYIGKEALEAARAEIEAGNPPYTHTLVGLRLGGRPIDDYASDFWLVSLERNGDPVGYLTSPWYSPELQGNIAMGHVPVEHAALGTALWVHLPDRYADESGVPVAAEVVEMPFRASVNPNQRELLKQRGLDAAV